MLLACIGHCWKGLVLLMLCSKSGQKQLNTDVLMHIMHYTLFSLHHLRLNSTLRPVRFETHPSHSRDPLMPRRERYCNLILVVAVAFNGDKYVTSDNV